MPIIFQTNRLLVRPLHPHDFEPFHEMQSNFKVMQYTTGRALTREENEGQLKGVIERYDRPGNDFWVWAIEEEATGQLVGTCALIKNDKKEYEIGYRFLEKYWGKGYGKEITRGLIEYGLNQPGIEELVAYVNKDNIPSVKILDATFRFEKEFFNEEEGCMDRYYKITK